MKKVIIKVINVILVLIILLATCVIVLTGVNTRKGKATMIFGYGFMAVQTGSMVPEYPIGSVVIIKKTDPAKLKSNDDISFYTIDPEFKKQGINIITHRIVEVKNDGDGTYSFTTKGVANSLNDEYPAEGEQVIGKVVAKSSLMAKLINIRQNPATFLLVIMLPLCVIIALELFSFSKRSTAVKDDKAIENKDENKK